MSRVTVEELNTFFKARFDTRDEPTPVVTEVGNGTAMVRVEMSEQNMRPGGFINGPTQMALADRIAYIAIFTKIGITPMALTSNLNIDFLRPCIGEVLEARAEIIKIGRTLAIISVEMFGDSSPKIASRATVTYALPKADA